MTAGERLIAEGEARGVAKGQRKLILRQLNARFPGKVTSEIEARLHGVTEGQLVVWGVRLSTVESIEDVFAD